MADGGGVRRRREAPERFEYRRTLERLMNFVDNELGNGRAPRPRPDTREWRIQRAKTITTLNGLGDKLDTVCVGANYVRAGANGAEIVGAGSAIVGSLMTLAGLPSGQMVLNAGNLVHHSGTLVDGISSVIESLVSAKYLSEVEAELAKDKALSQPLAEWLDFTRELDTNVQAIFGVSLSSEKWNTVMKVFYEFAKFSSSAKGFDATMRLMRQGRYSVYIGNDVKIEKLRMFFQHLSACPQFADRIRVTLSVLSVSTGAFQVFRDGVQAYRSIMGISNSSIVPTLQGGLNPDIPTASAVSVFCIFQTISMAISVVSLINATNIIKHGKSKYSDALKELTRSLTWELRRMEEL
ncbi:uncharacterized protein LOC129981825 [Argiope bruennichi]|uniref:uncharacterized protein LOC129981825 n=1 Tax=Argiope bruennichi TaxID=94029 RepID=UPI0024941490|nr:uncharacterized protein LOC129981825 [Argiope bruennichi]